MRRSLVLCVALVFFVLALAFSSLSITRTASAVPPDPCVKCQGKCQKEYDKCLNRFPVAEQQQCHDGFNSCIVVCYATVCEQ
jgi:hypothetical protein